MIELNDLINNRINGVMIDSLTNEAYKQESKITDLKISEILNEYAEVGRDATDIYVR